MITFVIPTVGRPTLDRAISSLLSQTCDDWKAIIVFDGIPKQEFSDPRIKSVQINKTGEFSKHHGMAGLVRNYGLKLVDTEWVGFLDDDDRIHPDYVFKLKNDFLSFDFIVWRMQLPNGKIIPHPKNNDLYFSNVGISYCYKRINSETLYFENNRDGEDFDMVQSLLKRTNNYIVTDDCYYFVDH